MRLYFVIFFVLLQLCSLGQEGWETRPDLPDNFPRPEETEELLFFIQRNRNENTIVYDLNSKADGSLDSKNPINAYWRRFHLDNGISKDLSWLELNFAYGYKSRKNKDVYTIKLKAYNEREIQLTLRNGKWTPIITINGQPAILKNLYIFANESKFWPSVLYADIYGESILTKALVKERIFNK